MVYTSRSKQPLALVVALGALLLGLFPCKVSAQTAAPEMWIAVRTDGRLGSGTQSDPYDGSTADLLVSLISHAAEDTVIHLNAGTFPIHQVKLRAGMQLIGAGKNETALEWDGTGVSNANIVCVVGDNVRVSDLTIDGRADLYPVTPKVLQSWDASNVTFQRVRATNMRADASDPGREWFPIAQISHASIQTGGLIDSCEVDHFEGYGTMISLGNDGYGGPSVYMSGIISNNYVHDVAAKGIGLSGAGHCIVTGNLIEGAITAIIHDTWFSPNVQIVNNQLVGCHQYGIIWSSDTHSVDVPANGSSDVTIADNQVNLTGERNDSAGIWVGGKSVTGSQIRNNTVTTTAHPTKYMASFILGYSDKTSMLHNRATNQLNPRYYQTGTDPLAARGNIFLSGAPMPLPETAVPAPPQGTLLNVSTRAIVRPGDNAVIGGFIITGDTPKKIILRAIGPSLASAGVKGALLDPILELHGADGSLIASNDSWRTNAAQVTAVGISPTDNRESAIVATLPPGPYTAIVRGAHGTSGVALVELYDLNPDSSQVANLSTRAQVDGNSHQLIGGFIVDTDTTARVMVRALGPSLASGKMRNTLKDPSLKLYDKDGSLLYRNDNWATDQKQQILDSGLAPTNAKEAATIASLPAGNYTAIVTGAAGDSGLALLEMYNLSD